MTKIYYANDTSRKCTIQFAKYLVHSANHLGLRPKAKEGHKNVNVYFKRYGNTFNHVKTISRQHFKALY